MSGELPGWLEKQLKQRGWTHSELAKRAGLSQAAVTSVINGTRKAGTDFCIKIAEALDETPEAIFRLAGLLPTGLTSDDPVLREILDTLGNMSPEQRQEALNYIRYLYQKREKRGEM